MDEIEFVKLMVRYKELSDQLAKIEKQIKDEIIIIQETRKVAGVSASYFQPREEYDYEKAARAHAAAFGYDINELIAKYSTSKTYPGWKEIVQEIEAPLDMFRVVKPARVVVKVK